MRDPAFILILALTLGALPGCSRRGGEEQSGGPVPSSTGSVAAMAAEDPGPVGHEYPPARWRMATFDELDRATLWVGHIAIRHKLSHPDGLRILNHRPDPPNPNRSVADALALAERIASLAASAPDDFEQLARTYSEDVLTKDDGGALGGVRASQLQALDFLDALATLKPGEVSKAFRTPYGFHVLKRYAPPSEEQVAGERIVIGYQGVFGPAGESRRSRSEAERIAREVAIQAKRSPEDFRALVERYSESPERVQDGDIGVFSTRDPAYLPVEVYRLARLAVGEVTGPHDSSFGFEVLKRVPVLPRARYAMAMIELGYDSSPPARAQSQAQALAKAEELGRTLGQAPERFEEFQRIHRSERIERWTRGRGDPGLTRALDALSFGQVASKPILYGNAYLIVKRLDANALPPEKPRFTELPLPSEPNYAELLKHNDGTQIAGAARSLVKEVETGSGLAPEVTSSIAETLGQLAATLEQQPADHAAVRTSIDSALAVLERRLSAEHFAFFKSFSRRWAVRQVMPPGAAD